MSARLMGSADRGGEDFGQGELVVGSFKSLRKFYVSPRGVTPLSCMGFIPFSTGVNKATCGMGIVPPDKINELFRRKANLTWLDNIRGVLIDAWADSESIILRGDVTRGLSALEIEHVAIKVTPQEILEQWEAPHPKDTVPSIYCKCGFYSFHDYIVMMNDTGYAVGGDLVGVVENTGRVIHGKVGLRSQHIKILGLTKAEMPYPRFYDDVEEEHIRKFGYYPSLKELLEEHPLDKL